MVNEQIVARDIKSPRVLDAMRKVPRHEFVPEAGAAGAYGDTPLPIGYDQTISQPYIVAYMSEALELDPRIACWRSVPAPDTRPRFSASWRKRCLRLKSSCPSPRRARETLARLGYKNVHVRAGNGYLGWPEEAPFDRVMVTAAPDEVPPALIDQLKVGGLMAIPVGHRRAGAEDPPSHGEGMETTAHAARSFCADDRQAETVECPDGQIPH